jgi:very-short-patch-repair endonuclease
VSFAFGGRGAEIDLLSRADELAIEIDGYHHFTDAEGYRRDRRKDLLLQAHGYAVVRFLADDVLADPRAAVGAVVELLGVRRGRQERQRRS